MVENLLFVAVIVIVFWIIIIGLFLVISRQQPEVQEQMRSLEEELKRSEE